MDNRKQAKSKKRKAESGKKKTTKHPFLAQRGKIAGRSAAIVRQEFGYTPYTEVTILPE